jgi:hypothetical protein
MRLSLVAITASALIAFVMPLAAAQDVLEASAQSDLLAPLDIPEGEQHQDVDTSKALGGTDGGFQASASVSEGKRGLNAVNVKKA